MPGEPPVTTTRRFDGDRAAIREAAMHDALAGFVRILGARMAPS